jgi:E3 ubiquitin-protein ligase MARCH6
MEWLSHSQKKYCELCKTPFRFTKFYSPNMPQSLPLSVFFRQLSRYVIENGLGWLRAIIAISFWATVLPWFMRRGWSSMLWLSQESWGASPGDPTTAMSTSGYPIHLSSTMIGLDTCPSSPLFAPSSTPAADIETMMGWWGSHTISGALLRMLRRMTGLPLPVVDGSGHLSSTSRSPQTYEAGSLLGNVQFLKTLTRNRFFNQVVISVLEGQIVTVVVIVSFILVILVRDYVVQQQPDLNLNGRGAFDVPEDGEQVPIAVQPARPPVADDTDESENEELGLGGLEQVPSQQAREARGDREQHLREAFPELQEIREAGAAMRPVDDPANPTTAIGPLPDRAGEPSSNQGPSNRWADVISLSQRSSDEGSTDTILTPDYSQEDLREITSSVTERKGKEKMEAPVDNAEQPSFQPLDSGPGPSSRPRSISDGPQVQGKVNPLANNTWSFTPSSTEQTSNDREDTPSSQLTFSRDGTMAGMRRPEYMRHDESDYSPGVFAHDDFDEALDGGLPEDLATHARLPSPSASPPEPRTAAADPRGPVSDWVTDFMWGDIEVPSPGPTAGPNSEDERFGVESDAESEDDMDGPLFPDDIPDEAIDDDAAGVDEIPGPAMDPEAIEDMEDFEGIMELLGMRGPITNLFQNVIFCAVLVQSALFSCVFIPFNVGRMAFWFAAKPMRIVRILFELSKVAQDLCFILGGLLSWMTFNMADMVTSHIGGPVASQVLAARKGSWSFFTGAGSRVGTFLELLVLDLSVPASGMQYWSAVSHEALMNIKSRILASFLSINSLFTAIATDPIQLAWSTPGAIWGAMSGLFSVLSNPGSWVLEFTPDQTAHVQLGHAHWQSADITWAILAGYATVFTLAGLYLKSGIRLARGTALEDWESGIIDFLHQASGILKVITIISIEMLVFPLYCGLLLDCALLPLFSGASVKSRLLFTYNNPWTSIFVHWFVGTGYMFHFALFVSMCRKIMRPGVLCRFPLHSAGSCTC